ncbi:MAG TPA: chemotaxis protein CheW [Chitinispirillaceae bacterium]|nr:chemotaxis protein CheW [Chitinispirillaceae bacterium]
MNARECLNRALAHLPMVDNQDLSILAGVLSDIDAIVSDEKLPEVLRKQASSICKFGEHIILNESDFDTGMKKLAQSLIQLEKTLSDLEQSPPVLSDTNSDDKNEESVLSSNDLFELRTKFAVQQKSLLDDFEAHILDLEKNVPGAQDAIKRMLHTWKGEFGVLDMSKMSGLIHSIEDSIEKNVITTDGLLKLKDHLTDVFQRMASNQPIVVLPAEHFIESICDQSPQPGNKISSNETENSPELNSVGSIPETDLSLLHDFIQESRDHINSAETIMLDLESDPTNTEFINSIFRSFHTIKGVSGFLGIKEVTQLAHSIENIIDQARKNTLIIKPAHIDILLQSMDCLKDIISNIESGSDSGHFEIPVSYHSIMEKLSVPDAIDIQFNSTDVSGPVKKLGTMLVEKGNIAKEQLVEALQKQDDGDPRRIGKILVQDNGVPARSVTEAIAVQSQSRCAKNVEETIRVPVNRLDQLIDAIGEAVISQSMITADPAIKSSTSQTLLTKIAQTNLIMRQIQGLSMSLRMVSVKATFQKMARLVRDLSKKSGKVIEFITEGEDTEIDKSVVENIGDPLIHMIRNSVDHGIEKVAEREASGKNKIAMIRLSAYHKAGNVFIEIQDDGKGLDKDAIYEKAVSKGLCRPNEKLTDNEIFQFIFLPGFSTAKVVTDVSGRGVGMDVVKRNIESLRGSVEMSSERGKGTTFTLRLPLTLAIIDGMVVKVGSETCIIPTLSIIETISTSSEQIVSVLGKGEMIKVRGSLIPLLHLSSIFNHHSKINGKAKVTLIIEDMLGRKAGLLVDEIIGQQQVVIKNLGNGLGEVPGISGGAIMSDGTVSLIIDISNIVRTAFGN